MHDFTHVAGILAAPWRKVELTEGDEVSGTVVRLPEPGTYAGNRLFVDTEDGIVAFRATEKTGHSVLANEPERQNVGVGDRVHILLRGWKATQDGDRTYRRYQVRKG